MSTREFRAAISPFAKPVRDGLTAVRALVLSSAKSTPGVGKLEEALKWGQFSFLTSETGSGSTIRIDGLRGRDDAFAMFFHCQSGLIDTYKNLYGDTFKYEGKRALIFECDEPLPTAELKHCIALALTHHLRKKAPRR